MLSQRWAGEPRWVRTVATVVALLLLWGCLQHLLDFATGGWQPYSAAPTWLAIYWSALTVLDPVAALLLLRRRRAGLLLAPTVLLTDAAANGYAVHVLGLGGPLAPVGQAVVTLLAVATVAVTPRLLDRTSPHRAPGAS